MVDHWTGLVRFLEEPELPLSNNHTEREVRGPVVGRKNFGGCESERGMAAGWDPGLSPEVAASGKATLEEHVIDDLLADLAGNSNPR